MTSLHQIHWHLPYYLASNSSMGKPRQVVGSRPPPQTGSIEALQQYGAYFGKIQKEKRGTRAGGSSKEEKDSQVVKAQDPPMGKQ